MCVVSHSAKAYCLIKYIQERRYITVISMVNLSLKHLISLLVLKKLKYLYSPC
uniref:Uncharacterized protein n=1 Tax=Octopus bimaculoides TaxID=37653 RepID=A0A0L8GV29_OCTBM